MTGRLAACAALALCLAGVAGSARVEAAPPANGVETRTPGAIVAAALAAGSHARSVHVHGGGVDGGDRISLDVHVGPRRGNGRISENGLGFAVIRLGATTYFKGGEAFWRKAGGPKFAQLAPLFAGKWMKASATKGDLAPLASLLDIRSLLGGILGNHDKLENGGTTTFHGQSAVAVHDTTKGGTLYVATTGPPYPLAVQQVGASGGTIFLDHWNAPLKVAAPKHAIDLTTFTKH